MSSALKAGWICFGIGLAISWFFPLGQAFFSVALITAIVAMCTHQVNRGLALLLSSFVAMAVCAAIFFVLVVGTIGMAVAPVARKANADLRKAQATRAQAVQQMNQASTQLQSNLNAINGQTAPQSFANTPAVPFATSPTSDQQRQHELAMRRQREADAQRAADDRQRVANVREAERQRDRSRAKEQHLEQLQASVDYWDRQVKDARLRGGDSRWLEAQREDAWSKKQEFVGR
jgi:hypothetical protein